MTEEKKPPVWVTIRDVRAAGMCASGARDWFARYGLDWSAFVQYGLPAPAILATKDALGEVVVAKATARGIQKPEQVPSNPKPEQLPGIE